MNITQINNIGYAVTASTNTFTIQKIDAIQGLIILQHTLVTASQTMRNFSTVSVNKSSDPSIKVIQ